MLCQNCHARESTVHFTKIINGQATQMHLCSECAQKVQGFSFGFSLNPAMVSDFLQALFGVNPAGHAGQTVNILQQEKCPGCGKTFAQIQQTGRMGCRQCYEKFEPQMEQLLRRIHGGGAHVGKTPLRCGAAFRSEQEKTRLKKKLQELVAREEFEEAAKVRDRIRELEKTAGGEET
ncbi:MAG: UvrB/UvrC motif-containing protein [Desulfitobacteriia bacterium]|jgi:protein arginine kinase activator